MLIRKDPMTAVDMFSKYPIPSDPTFDDAYIVGEIVRLLMKEEKFDDPRLGPNLICFGKIMGIGECIIVFPVKPIPSTAESVKMVLGKYWWISSVLLCYCAS